MNVNQPILPPAMLGILGGGQLGRMFAAAAKSMGYQVTVLDPSPDAPAAAFADKHLCAAYDDADALKELSRCAAVTTEFENVDADAMRMLAKHTRVSPSGDCVAIAQNRLLEKSQIRQAGLNTAPYLALTESDQINEQYHAVLPGIVKTATLGYDGKGQIRVNTLEEIREAFSQLGRVDCVVEKLVDLRAEISVIVCRLNNEAVHTFDPAENFHENGILAYSIVPARLPQNIQNQAKEMAVALANQLNYEGVLAVELFVVGDSNQLIVNEIAPRPHNSGHHTIDACINSQFVQQVRIMCNLLPGHTTLLSPCCMANILGDVWPQQSEQPNWLPLLQYPQAHLHLYEKADARKGRKMGHFTVLAEHADTAYATAQALHKSLTND